MSLKSFSQKWLAVAIVLFLYLQVGGMVALASPAHNGQSSTGADATDQARKKDVSDSTSLIVVDEADRLQMNSLEQVRSIFDSGRMA